MTIFVTSVRALNSDELLVLASYAGVPGHGIEAEAVLDTACSRKGVDREVGCVRDSVVAA